VCREYFSIIFNVKKCALYSIKYVVIFEFDKLKKLTNSGPTENSKTVGVGEARED
jgi:hypothetical protein